MNKQLTTFGNDLAMYAAYATVIDSNVDVGAAADPNWKVQ